MVDWSNLLVNVVLLIIIVGLAYLTNNHNKKK